MSSTLGRRIQLNTEGRLYPLAPGDFGKDERGVWMCCTPTGDYGDLGRHKVEEHADGTITVTPSIRVSITVDGRERELWHGYLSGGVWTSC